MTGRVPGLILAGGRSSRMGSTKALLGIGQERMIDRVLRIIAARADPVVISVNDPDIAPEGMIRIADLRTGFPGPLAGLEAGLHHLARLMPDASHALTATVDCPFLPDDLLDRLSAITPANDTIVLAASRGQKQPLVGLWPLTLAPALTQWLDGGEIGKVGAFLKGRDVRIVDFPDHTGAVDPFFNLNTPDDLAEARRIIAEYRL